MEFVTILTFTYAHEAFISQSKLESEGVTSYLKDENTTQIYGFYSNAIGGVKLQVLESDVQKAIEILNITVEENIPQSYTFISKLQMVGQNIPLLKNVQWELRLLIIAVVIVVSIIAIVGVWSR